MTWDNFLTLLMLIFLQAVLGFDNLLYISLESKRVALEHRSFVRRTGIGIAIALRIVLLFVLVGTIQSFTTPLFHINWTGWVEASIHLHALIVLVGGGFILFTAVKEINHLLSVSDLHTVQSSRAGVSVWRAIAWIVVMNAVFSFDSILSAIALTDVIWVMTTAIVVSGVLMVVMADRVATFLEQNRMYEVLGLFILLLVGVMLLTEGGHLAHLTLNGHPIEPMSKSTFYFVIGVLVAVDVIQDRYARILRKPETGPL